MEEKEDLNVTFIYQDTIARSDNFMYEYKEPFSIEASTSGNHLTFMERGLPNAFLSDGRNTGIMFHNTALENRMTWAVGVFEDSDKFGESFDDFSDFNVTARVTGLPWYADEGSKLLHLGFSYSHQFRSENDTPVRFRARPEAHITDARLVDTGKSLQMMWI